MAETRVPTITVQELARRRASGDDVCVLDVREPWELSLASLPGCLHIPLQEIAQRLQELDTQSEIIVMCKVGGRSLAAATFLNQRGFHKVYNLEGGINAWRRHVDPTLPDY